MSLWGKNDQPNNAPTFVVNAATGARGEAQFGNTVFGVGVAESQAARGDGKGSMAPGWVVKTTVGSRERYETLAVVRVQGDATVDGNNAYIAASANGAADDTELPDA